MTKKSLVEAITRKTKDPKYDIDNDGDLDAIGSGGQESKNEKVSSVYGRRGIKEDAPTVNAGSGNIAGIGVGSKGEPGVSKKRQKSLQQQNSEASQKRCTDVMTLLRRQPPQVTTGSFCGKKTFIVPDRMVNEVRIQKRKGKWWTNYLGENDDISNAIREYANANPSEPIILEGENYGHIVFARYGKQ